MNDLDNKNELITSDEASCDLSESAKQKLKEESNKVLNKIIEETDYSKTKDLTVLFNINQTKKTMARVNKLNELLDVITDQAIKRFSEKPDNFSNQELLQGLKVVQDIVERGQKQVSGVDSTPLIQINQQTNEVNVNSQDTLSKTSRDRVKNAVMSVLKGLGVDNAVMQVSPEDIIEVEPIVVETTNEQEEDKK